MIRGRYRLVLLTLFALMVGFSLGTIWRSRQTGGITTHLAREATRLEGVPRVNAEIIRPVASPDFSRIALALRTKQKPSRHSDEYSYSAAIFDPVGKRIIARNTWYGNEFKWSPDSKWLAVPDDNAGNGVLVIDRDGCHRLVLRREVGWARFTWRESSPHKFVYATAYSRIREYDVDTGVDRLLVDKKLYQVVGLFNVKGRLCAAFWARRAPSEQARDRVFVTDVDTGRIIVNVPGYGAFGGEDGVYFDMSPDGEHFVVRSGSGLSTVIFIGRTANASTTFKTHATIYSDGGADQHDHLSWSPGADPYNRMHSAIINSSAKPPIRFDPRWCRYSPLKLYPQVKHGRIRDAWFGWWKDDSYLAVDQEGLWVTNCGQYVPPGTKLPNPLKEYLVLRHTKRE